MVGAILLAGLVVGVSGALAPSPVEAMQADATSVTSTAAVGLGGADCYTTATGAPFVPGTDVQPCTPPPSGPAPSPTLPAPGPPAGERPGPGNTGPAAGTVFTEHKGDLVISTAGQIVDSVLVRGAIRVTAPGVTIRNSLVTGRAGLVRGQPLIYAGLGSSAGLRIENTEIAPTDANWVVNGIYGYGFTVDRVDIHRVVDAVHIFGDDVVVKRSWFHDHYHGPDPGQPDKVTHDDSIQIQNGRNIRIVGNAMSGAYNAALQVTQGTGVVADLTFSDNWVAGGQCSLNIAEGNWPAIEGLTITGNTLGESRFTCPLLMTPETLARSVVEKNVWEVSKTAIHLTCRAPGKPNWRC
ncbi:hypothetical protein [Marisediminicola sp. LYQ85]|uniref:hypothetical protein n=1 Tax=Marisediminicola sp. LYQ85 TaxID=3391062 RepID=UPI00398350B3